MDILATTSRPVIRCAQVVLHITRSSVAPILSHRLDAPAELAEDMPEWLPHHIAQHIQPPTMRHSDHNALHTTFCCGINQLLRVRTSQ